MENTILISSQLFHLYYQGKSTYLISFSLIQNLQLLIKYFLQIHTGVVISIFPPYFIIFLLQY